MFDHAFQEIQPASNPVSQVNKWLLHRLADQCRSGKMHDDIRERVRQCPDDARTVRKIRFDEQGIWMDRGPMSLRQIVDHDDRMSFANQLGNDDAPYVTRSTRDEYLHTDSEIKIPSGEMFHAGLERRVRGNNPRSARRPDAARRARTAPQTPGERRPTRRSLPAMP